jgi:SRSO17 transposase
VLDRTATTWLAHLLTWLELFEASFGHVAQRGALRRYVQGVLSDSRRKSMEAMWARVQDPGTYQAFQHFITHAPWRAEAVWRTLRTQVPARSGVLILDATSFPKQGPHSVGVARQYCGALGKIASCQVAVTVALWTGTQAWLLGATMYLPEAWLTPAQRVKGRIPPTVVFRPKWQLALTLLRQVRAAGIELTAVVADAEFGESATLRRALHRLRLPYALGVSKALTVFRGTPALVSPRPPVALGRPRRRPTLAPGTTAVTVTDLAATIPTRQWRLVRWRNGTNAPWAARFAVVRVTPAHDWRQRRLAPEVWLLCERDLGTTPRTKYYLVDLPATTPLPAVVQLAHQRWAIEQQYQELKDELGLDHFEGRSLPGWERHVVLTALAYTFLQRERQRRANHGLTLPQVRAIVQEILTAHFFITHPDYVKWMFKLKDVELRI